MAENRFKKKSTGIDKEGNKLSSGTVESKVKKGYLIKLDPDFKDSLTAHFASKGLNFSAGVRMLLHEYANEERIR